MRDELWFIEFGRGAALPLTPEEAPTDGEPVVPCAQGRIVVETTHPAPPHFATCSTYRHTIIDASEESPHSAGDLSSNIHFQSTNRGAVAKFSYHRVLSNVPQNLATRPEDLQVTPWYTEESIIDSSIRVSSNHQHSYPSSFFSHNDQQLSIISDHSMITGSLESDIYIATLKTNSSAPRKACMDLTDAIALLDETCPNPDVNSFTTPKTPRTSLTLQSRNKRARSKSSDNSSNCSNERLNDRSIIDEGSKDREKIRPFLRKIGISKTEDRPFFSKIAPRIGIGKPYLEKIGPSKAVEKPFLESIGSSKTLDKFTFDTLREMPKTMIRRTHTIVEPVKIEEAQISDTKFNDVNNSIFIVKNKTQSNHVSVAGQRSNKGPLLKMFSFETEDLDETCSFTTKIHREPLRGASLDDVLNCGTDSLPSVKNTSDAEELSNSKVQSNFYCSDVAQLVKCRVTTSEEIVSSNIKGLASPRAINWLNSSQWRAKQTDTSRALVNSRELLSDTDSIINSPTKRSISKVSIQQQIFSPTKSRRHASEEQPDVGQRNAHEKALAYKKLGNKTASAEFIPSTKRKTFNEIVEKFNESDYISIKAKRQISDEILDKSELGENYHHYNERRGISSDNLKYSREMIVGSAPSASSLSYQYSGDASLISHRSKKNNQDIFRNSFRMFTASNSSSSIGTPTTSTTITNNSITCNSERYKYVETDKVIGLRNSNSRNEGIVKDNIKDENSRTNTVKSVLKKQGRVESNDREIDIAGSIRKPMRKIFHQPSQETIDLLTELRIVKSLLKTPSEEGKDWELDCLKPARLPKKISLSDKEFCLSIERENSIRRPMHLKMSETDIRTGGNKYGDNVSIEEEQIGPALFEKRCLSLDYADDVKPIKAEVRAISLTSTGISVSAEENKIVSSDPLIIYDSKNCLSDVFISPTDNFDSSDDTHNTDDTENKTVRIVNVATKPPNNHFLEVDIAIPIDETGSISPKRRIQIQGKTSDLYEIISPRSTPFRVKKRLGRISVEETMKQESFAIGKVTDGRSVVTQKKTKCFPL